MFTFRFTFSPPSLRPGVVVVCLVTLCHSACAMISGILAGGIPGFRMVLCCFPHLRVWPCVCVCFPFSLFGFLFVFGHTRMWWHNVAITCMHHQWTGCQSFSCVRFLVLCWFCLCFACFSLFRVPLLLVDDDDGLLDYVQVLHQFSFVALNSRWPWILICNYCFCNVI